MADAPIGSKEVIAEDVWEPAIDGGEKLSKVIENLIDGIGILKSTANGIKNVFPTGDPKSISDLEKQNKAIAEQTKLTALNAKANQELQKVQALQQKTLQEKEKTEQAQIKTSQLKAKTTQTEIGLINNLRSELKQVTKDWAAATDAEQLDVNVTGSLAQQKLILTNNLKKLEGATGDHRREVGNYTQSVIVAGKALGGLTGLLAIAGSAFGIDTTSIQNLTLLHRELIGSMRDLTHVTEAEKLATEGNTTAMEANTIATEASTEATEGLAVAMTDLEVGILATGIGALVIVLGALAYSVYSSRKETEQLNIAAEKQYKDSEDLSKSFELQERKLRALGVTEGEIAKQKLENTKLALIAAQKSLELEDKILDKTVESFAKTEALSASSPALGFIYKLLWGADTKDLDGAIEKQKKSSDLVDELKVQILEVNKLISDTGTKSAKDSAKDRTEIEEQGVKDRLELAKQEFDAKEDLSKGREDIIKEQINNETDFELLLLEDKKNKKKISESEYDEQVYQLKLQALKRQEGLYDEDSQEYKKLLNDELKLTIDYEGAKIKARQDGSDKADEDRQKRIDAEKEANRKIIESAFETSKQLLTISEDRLKYEQDLKDGEIDRDKENIKIQTALAAAGQKNTLDFEQQQLAKHEEEKAALEKKAANRKKQQDTLDIFTAFMKEFAKDGSKGIGEAIKNTLGALAAGKAVAGSAFEGTEDTGGAGTVDNKGGKLWVLHPHEGVANRKGNEANPGLIGAMNTGRVDEWFKLNYLPNITVADRTPKENLALAIAKTNEINLQRIERAIKDIPRIENFTNELAELVTRERRNGNEKLTTHKVYPIIKGR